jgi:hypothetical protein
MVKKIIITESQLKVLLEQIPDSRFGRPEDNAILYKSQSNNLGSLDFDDLVDVVSALIDGVPGIGTLVSAGIDIVHSMTYAVRFYFSKNDDEKFLNGMMCIVTLGSTFIPGLGNSLNIIAKNGIKGTIKHTPAEVLLVAKKIGLYNKAVFFLSKTKWKYSILMALARILRNKLVDFLVHIKKSLTKLKNNVHNKQIEKAIDEMLAFINEMETESVAMLQIVQTLDNAKRTNI